MAEVTKEDLTQVYSKIGEVHKRIDDIVTCNTAIQISVAKIDTKFESFKIPEPTERPCEFIKDHLEDHKETVRLWQKPFVRTFVDLIKMAIVAGATWLFVRLKE